MQVTEQLSRQAYSGHCQTFKIERFAKRIMPECTCVGTQPEIFQSRGSFMELGHFDKHFVKNTRKKCLAVKYFRVFSPRYS